MRNIILLLATFAVSLLLFSAQVYGEEHVFFRIEMTTSKYTGTSGQLGYTYHETGNAYIYDNGWIPYGYYMATYVKAYGTTSDTWYSNIRISEAGTPPTFNFTLNGHYNWSTGEEYGGISSVPEYNDQLPGAYYTAYPVANGIWEIDIVIP